MSKIKNVFIVKCILGLGAVLPPISIILVYFFSQGIVVVFCFFIFINQNCIDTHTHTQKAAAFV